MASWTSKLFEEIAVGDDVTLVHAVDAADVELIAMVTGDRVAMDGLRRTAARSTQAVGAAVLITNAIGSRLPGPGSVIVEESLRCTGRITVGDVVTAGLRVREKRPEGRLVVLDLRCTNQRGEVIAEGATTVECPAERVSVEPLGDIDVAFHRSNAFARLFERCRGMPPVVTAVVHPCDRESLRGAMEAAAKQLAYLAAAESAGIVLGTRVPIALTSRADNARSREASTAIMALVAHARRQASS
jgi:phosphate acetyltransferase